MKPGFDSQPHAVITVGIPGSGKSYFAERFAHAFKSPLYSLDRISEVIDAKSFGSKELSAIINYFLTETLKTKQTVVYDGPTYTKKERSKLVKLLRSSGYEPLFVWVQTDLKTAEKRYAKSSRYSDQQNRFEELVKEFDNPSASDNLVVISGKHAFKTQLQSVLRKLANPSVKKSSNLTRIHHVNKRIVIR